jgi:hypothetical protein
MPRFAKRGIWCGASEAGRTQASVDAYVDRMHGAGFNLLLVHLKGGDGLIYWPSETFADFVAPGYQEFDLPAALLNSCRERGIELHAWFIDYMEGTRIFDAHPEWAQRDARGNPTNAEVLRGKPFPFVWMCPAQRPGYTDQWLVPLYAEFAEKYAFDAIHHDYIRYPGDLAPDQYCFCDSCLGSLPKWAGYQTEAFPDEPFFHEVYDREYLEAHWEQSPRVLPANWSKLDRNSKSRFLLEGNFFQGGRADLDYFFYTYRVHNIREFARLSAEAVRKARPEMKLSAAVFKNPIHSGRFIGQDWRQFKGYVDQLLPMDYRDHYPGDFETYLVLLKESIAQQQVWATGFESLWPGFAINFLYKEEDKAGDPAGPEKLARVVDAIASTGVDGITVFCEGHLHQYKLWEAAREIFQA